MERTDFNQLTWFQAVAEERSFTKAAARLGVAQSTLSHAIKQLEARMGIRLLTRTTRNVATTVAGERLLQTVAPRMSEIEEEIAALTAFRDKPSGSIRLTLSDHALQTVVWPKLKPVLQAYPDISVELLLDSSFRNIVEEGFRCGGGMDTCEKPRRVREGLDRPFVGQGAQQGQDRTRRAGVRQLPALQCRDAGRRGRSAVPAHARRGRSQF